MVDLIFPKLKAIIPELYLVGGSVRDLLLHIEPKDLDFATPLLPDEIESALQKAGCKTYDIGKAFGTVRCDIDGMIVEITTYRKNENYQRNNRRPVVEWGKTIQDDLARRDFTFNALAMDSNGKIVDLFCGQEHLHNGVIDTPLDPEVTFDDDPLRILRAIRFRSRFGFEYSNRVKEALASKAYRLLFLPKERVVEELNKILLGDFVKDALYDLVVYKIINYIIPEIVVLKNFKQESIYHHKDVFGHTVDVVANTPKDLVLRWSGLLHDIGKPYTFSDDEGAVHFYRHEEVSCLMAESILKRLGMSNKMTEDICFLVKNHMKANLYDHFWSSSAVRRFVVDSGEHVDNLLLLSKADITSHKPEKVQEHLNDLEDLKKRIEEVRNYVELKCPVSGFEIMSRFNLSQGPEVGRLIDLLMEAIKNGELNLGEDKEVYLKFLEGK
jgi:poly(A) polymerase